MAVAVSTMILASLRMTGEKTRGDTLTSTEQTECLAELNSMLDSWSIQRLNCYQLKQENFSLTTSTQSYTIGSGATFNTARPTRIVDPCFVRDSSNMDSPLTIISPESYGSIVMKGTGTTYPSYLSYDQGLDSSGYGTITVYPVPSANLTLYINSWKAVGSFPHVSTSVTLPPGYQAAIEANYAVRSIAGLDEPSAVLMKLARDTLTAIRSQNLPEVISKVETGVIAATKSSRRSILTGP